MDEYKDLTPKEVEIGIRQSLRQEFPNTAFRVEYDGDDLYINIIGGEFCEMKQLSEDVQERIQNCVFEVAPILMLFEDSDLVG
jgi:hypothetical protein